MKETRFLILFLPHALQCLFAYQMVNQMTVLVSGTAQTNGSKHTVIPARSWCPQSHALPPICCLPAFLFMAVFIGINLQVLNKPI